MTKPTSNLVQPKMAVKEPSHELEMARNRFILGVFAWSASYLLNAESFISYAFACYLSAHLMLYLMVKADVLHKEINYLIAIIIDSVMGAAILLNSPESTSFVYPLFLWMTLGTGFRLGLKWIFVASIFRPSHSGFQCCLLTIGATRPPLASA
jgi:two-component system, sensor histidine kinase RpfC